MSRRIAVSESTFKRQLMAMFPAHGILAYRKSGAWDAGVPEILAYRNPVFAVIEAKTAGRHPQLWAMTRPRQRIRLTKAWELGAVAVIASKLRSGAVIASIAPARLADTRFHLLDHEFKDTRAFIAHVFSRY
jgi:Holliday junction resolvase